MKEKEREDELKSLADFTSENPQPAMRISKDCRLLYANASSAPMIMEWGSRIGKRVPDEWCKLVTDVLQTGIRQNVECEVRKQIFSFVVVPIRGVYVNLYGLDITNRKRAEEKVQKAYNELKKTQSQLIQAEKMNVVGRLASGVAHEVKNPLSTILQGIEYLSKNINSEDKSVSTMLGYMENAVKKADDIVKGLLDFGGSSALDIKAEDINPVIEGALCLMKHQLDKNHLRVVKDLRKGLPKIDIDRNRIEQVMINIIMNSVNATPPAGLITIKSHLERRDRVEGLAGVLGIRQKRVIVEIENTGEVIPDEILAHIFEPFFTTERDKGGAGLGLSIVKNIIDMHSAKIEIKNKEGGGVKVTLTFEV